MNGCMAEGVQGECRRSKGVRGCVQLNVHVAAQGQNRLDIFRGPSVMVRSLCLSIIRVLGFLDRGIS